MPVTTPSAPSRHHLRKSDAPYFAELHARRKQELLAALAQPHTKLGEAQDEVGVSAFLVRSWREQDPEFDWNVRLALLTNGTGRWLCGGGPAMTALLEQQAKTPPAERMAWPEVRAAIEASGEAVGQRVKRPKVGRPRRPLEDEQVDALMDYLNSGKVSLTEAVRMAGMTMDTLDRLRRVPEFDWDVRFAVLTHSRSRRHLPGATPQIRAALEFEAAQDQWKRRTWAEVMRDMEIGRGPIFVTGELVGADAAAPPPAEPGTMAENF